MQSLLTWADAYARLEHRLSKKDDLDSEIHTEELLLRRLDKYQNSPYVIKHARLKTLKSELVALKATMQEFMPKVWGTPNPTHLSDHEIMSVMNDKCKVLEANIEQYLSNEFSKMKKLIPKVFQKIIEGVNEDVINFTFKMMRKVINGQISERDAFDKMSQHSESIYNLPKGFYKKVMRQ